METTERELANAWQLSQDLGLPANWIREQAKLGRIPCLRAGRKLRFSPSAVRAALARLAASQTYEGEVFETAGR